jgi:putative transposase
MRAAGYVCHKVFLADSEGGLVANPRHFWRGEQRLAHAQRTLCRRKRGSHRRRKAARAVARKHLKVGRQRRDLHFKTVNQYASGDSRIGVDDLNVAAMARNHHLAMSIRDAGWGAFLGILEDKAARAGRQVI